MSDDAGYADALDAILDHFWRHQPAGEFNGALPTYGPGRAQPRETEGPLEGGPSWRERLAPPNRSAVAATPAEP